MEEKIYTAAMNEYLDYLRRYTRTSDMGLFQAHQLLMNRVVAKEYGVTEEQIRWLDKNL